MRLRAVLQGVRRKVLDRAMWSRWGLEHGPALLLYAVAAVIFSWPAVRDFSTRIISDGGDAKHQLYMLWHTQQWALGHQPLFYAPLLFYPGGISLLLHSLGPVMGLFALPFWPWGPAAAYNGSVLVALCLTGYCMYLLARGLGLERMPALFAGLLLLVAPIHLASMQGHLERTFLGLPPLALLALHRSLDQKRSAGWSVATALALLATGLYSGYQFVYAALALGFFVLVAWLQVKRATFKFLLVRTLLLACCCAVLVGPYLYAVVRVESNPAFAVELYQESFVNSPDLVQLFLPPYYHVLWGTISLSAIALYHAPYGIDYIVSFLWTGIVLSLIAWLWAPRQTRRWLVLALLAILLSLGPSLRAFGETVFTEYKLPIILPYAFLTALPGLEFMRIPGRFMMLAYIGIAVGAGFGLSWLTRRFPRWKLLILAASAALLLLEAWPSPRPQETLPPVPEFYQQIAQDTEMYGVLDLPMRSGRGLDVYCTSDGSCNYPSDLYEYYQITHHKGIFLGYVSRSYVKYAPLADLVASCRLGEEDILVNGESERACSLVLVQLARMGFRYVVWHKTLYPDSPGQGTTAAVISQMFGDQRPVADDSLVTVYKVGSISEVANLPPVIFLNDNWYPSEGKWRWAASPATLTILSQQQQPALIEIIPAALHDPSQEQGIGRTGLLRVQAGSSLSLTVELAAGRVATIPLVLPPGPLTLTLDLAAGNFQPSQYGSPDGRSLSFAVRSINLLLPGGMALPDDIHVNGQARQGEDKQILALFGKGWYDFEGDPVGRWAQSPAEILLYSPITQSVRLEAQPTFMYLPSAPGGVGDRGLLYVRSNEDPVQSLRITSGRLFGVYLPLRAGWNRVALELEAGNFRPSALQPDSTDTRWLSFALQAINIAPK